MSQEEGFAELLQYQLKSLQEKNVINEWKTHLQSLLDTQKSSYLENTKIVANIESELNDLTKLNQCMCESQKKLDSSIETSKSLKDKCEKLRLENERLSEEIEKKNKEYNNEKEQVEAQRKQINEKHAVINTSSELYEKLLGLEIRVLNGNRMQFVFKSPNKPDCFIIISLNERVYGITESYPVLENLTSMENALNKTNNLAGFIQYCRMALRKKLENCT